VDDGAVIAALARLDDLRAYIRTLTSLLG